MTKIVTDKDLGEGLEIQNSKLNAKLIFEDEEYEVPRERIEALIFKRTKNAAKPFICTGVKVAGKWWGDAPEGEVAGDFRDLVFLNIVSASPRIEVSKTAISILPNPSNKKLLVTLDLRIGEIARIQNDPENTNEKLDVVFNRDENSGNWVMEPNKHFPSGYNTIVINGTPWVLDEYTNRLFPDVLVSSQRIEFSTLLAKNAQVRAFDGPESITDPSLLVEDSAPRFSSPTSRAKVEVVERTSDYVSFETSPVGYQNLRNAKIIIDFPNGRKLHFYTHLVSVTGNQVGAYSDPSAGSRIATARYRGTWLEVNRLHAGTRSSNYLRGKRNQNGFDEYGFRQISYHGIENVLGNVNLSKTVLKFNYSVFPKGTRVRIFETDWKTEDFLLIDEIL